MPMNFFGFKSPQAFGIPFVDVEPGTFSYLGREVTLTVPFRISKTLVTFEHLAHFAKFAGVKPVELFQKDYPSQEKPPRAYRLYEECNSIPIVDGVFSNTFVNIFIQGLNQFEAKAGRANQDWVYRLPTEAEYYYAAAGSSCLRFPWGDQWSRDMVVGLPGNPEEAGSIPKNASWCGALDMLALARSCCLDHLYSQSRTYSDESEIWNNTPVKDPLLLNPKGWAYSPVAKGRVSEKEGTPEGDNMSRYYGDSVDGNAMGLRIVQGRNAFNIFKSKRSGA
jgi:hypothetical protein